MKSRSAAMPAPKNDNEALTHAARWAELDAAVAASEAERTAAHARIDAMADAVVTPMATEMATIAKLLKPWWAVRGAELTGGKRKSMDFGGCHIGERTGNPTLKHRYRTDGEAVIELLGTRWSKLLIRTKHSLDKRVLLKVLGIGDKMSAAIAALGFRVDQADSFFIERAASAAVRPDEVA